MRVRRHAAAQEMMFRRKNAVANGTLWFEREREVRLIACCPIVRRRLNAHSRTEIFQKSGQRLPEGMLLDTHVLLSSLWN